MHTFNCEYCGAENTKRQKGRFCNRSCAGKASGGRPRTGSDRECKHCGKLFYIQPSQPDIYCSYECSKKAGTPRKAGLASYRSRKKLGVSKKDQNHDLIVDTLERLGCSVLDLSPLGCGCPDILVLLRGVIYLVEIKNLNTTYGRKGLNENQQHFADWWNGGPIYVVCTVDDCIDFVQGDRERLAYSPARPLSIQGSR